MLHKLLTYHPHFKMYEPSFLLKILQQEARRSQVLTSDDYILHLLQNKNLIEKFDNELKISYSQFYRDEMSFVFLGQQLLPKLIAKKQESGEREIRIWSCACAAGQEAYTIAMILDQINQNGGSEINFQLFATDIDNTCIEMAKAGIYSSKSLQNLPLKYVETYFEKHNNNQYLLKDSIKETVDFSIYDLLDEEHQVPPASLYGHFDIIFCKNVLYYYNNEVRLKILSKINKALSSGGYLFVSPSEQSIIKQCVNCKALPYTSIYRKTKSLI